jgi:hypothetical protein
MGDAARAAWEAIAATANGAAMCELYDRVRATSRAARGVEAAVSRRS